MKTVVAVVLMVVGLVECHKGGFGRGGHGQCGDKACRIVYNDGTEESNPCPSALYTCEQRLTGRIPVNVTALYECQPIQCTSDAQCSSIDSNSLCSNFSGPVDSQLLADCGLPYYGFGYDGYRMFRFATARCTIPTAYMVMRKACLVTDQSGATVSTNECPVWHYYSASVCSSDVTCQVTVANQVRNLYFCEDAVETVDTPLAPFQVGRGRGGGRG